MTNYVILSKGSHAAHGYLPRDGWRFAAGEQVIPVLQAELGRLLPHYVLAFVSTGGESAQGYQLVALAGLGDSNLYVAPNNKWLGDYVPALLRGHPFRLALHEGRHVLCIAEEHLVEGGQGKKIFGDKSELTADVARTLEFLQQCAENSQMTTAVVTQLAEAGLIESWPLQLERGKDRDPLVIKGLHRINEKALNALEPEALHALHGGPLAMAYAQMFSSYQLHGLVRRAEFLAGAAQPAQQADLDELFGEGSDELSFGF